jgi:hypothetical protein
MFRAVFWFELCFWLRSRLLYSLLLTTTGILFLSMATQLIRFRGPGGIQIRNTALTVQLLYQYLSAAGFLIFASFPIAAATRDHTYQMSEIIFTTSVSRFGWLLGRFTASTIIALIPLCGISAGILIGSVMPWNEPSQCQTHCCLPPLHSSSVCEFQMLCQYKSCLQHSGSALIWALICSVFMTTSYWLQCLIRSAASQYFSRQST